MLSLKKKDVFILFCFLLFFVPSAVSAETVLQTGFQESSPKYILQNSTISGICFDIIVELNRRLQEEEIRISYPQSGDPFVPWKRIQRYLQSGELDIVVGMAKNNQRQKIYAFSKESFYTIRAVFAQRSGGVPAVYQSFTDLGEKQVIAVRGTKTAKMLVENHVNISLTHSPTAALQMLLADRGELVFYHDLGLAYIIKENAWQNRVILGSIQSTYEHFIGYNRSVPLSIRNQIDNKLRSMKNDGTISDILERYR